VTFPSLWDMERSFLWTGHVSQCTGFPSQEWLRFVEKRGACHLPFTKFPISRFLRSRTVPATFLEVNRLCGSFGCPPKEPFRQGAHPTGDQRRQAPFPLSSRGRRHSGEDPFPLAHHIFLVPHPLHAAPFFCNPAYWRVLYSLFRVFRSSPRSVPFFSQFFCNNLRDPDTFSKPNPEGLRIFSPPRPVFD